MILYLELSWINLISIKNIQRNVKKSNFQVPVLSDWWLDGKLHENSRFCRVFQYFFTVIHLERHWKCPWKLRKCPWKSPWKVLEFFFLETCTHHVKVKVSITHPGRGTSRAPSHWVHISRSRWVLHIQWGERPQGHHPTGSTSQGQDEYYTSSEERDLKGTIPLGPHLKVKMSIIHQVRRGTSRAPSHWVHISRSRWVLHIQWGEGPQGHHPTESTSQGQDEYYTSSEERDLKGTIPLSPHLKVKMSITHLVRRGTSRAPSHWVHGSRSKWVLHIQWGEGPQGRHPIESTAQDRSESECMGAWYKILNV